MTFDRIKNCFYIAKQKQRELQKKKIAPTKK